MNDYQPIHTEFMDPDLKLLWDRLPPRELSTGGFMLFGGTALAMYMNHRASTDLDFFTASGSVNPDTLRKRLLHSLEKRFQIVGQEGAVDVKWEGSQRTVLMNFVDFDYFFGLKPEFEPYEAPNGIPVARPTDVLVGKLAALKYRGIPRDYKDISAAAKHMPEELDYAIERYVSLDQRLDDRRELVKTLLRYPFEVEYGLTEEELATIDRLAKKIDSIDRGPRGSGFER